MLSEVPEGWNRMKFIEFVLLKRGYDLPVAQRVAGCVPVVASNGQVGWHNQAKVKAPVVVTGRSGTIGKVELYETDCHPLNTTLYSQSLNGNDPWFAKYFLEHFQMERFSTGTGVPTLNRNYVHEADISVPPPPEQKRIAKILSSVDESIQTTQSVIDQAERVKRGLMEDLLTGGLGSEAIARGEVPEGWEKATLCDLFLIKSSKRVLRSQWRKSGVPFYRGREISALAKDGSVDNELFIDECLYKELSQKHGTPSVGDILVTAIGTIGNAYLVREDQRFYFKDASVLWLENFGEAVADFIIYWFQSSLFMSQLDVGNGTTVDSLTISSLKSCGLSLPPLPEQKRIAEILSSVDAFIQSQKQIIDQYQVTKKGLMDDLLTGRVRTV